MDHTTIGLAGEFYVLAQLAQRGIIASFTLANTKGVDILVSDATLNQLFKVEVKTTIKKIHKESLYSNEPFYHWPMAQKHEKLAEPEFVDPKLVFCFVAIGNEDELPRFFVVPSRYVGAYVREQHLHWLKTRGSSVAQTSMRVFRIRHDDPLGFESNWQILTGSNPEPNQLYLSESWCNETLRS